MKKNILICPLEWGLGHATRMIPLADELLRHNHNVIFASGEEHLSLIRNELPRCSFLSFPGFKPGYSRHLPPYISILLKIPLLLYHIILEHARLKKIIRRYSIDIVISDNRFGLWNSKIKSVYVTHMPLIPFPRRMRFLEPLGVFIHRQIIMRYDLCFIPDLPGAGNLTGRLSHGMDLPGNVRYIGILSRFTSLPEVSPDMSGSGYNTIILSGPEPQKEILKQKLIKVFKDREPLTVLLEARPGDKEENRRLGNIILYNHLPSLEMKRIILFSDGIISRSGYTTVMDLVSLNCRALLIPTPGQTEQEYLAEHLSEQGLFVSMRQNAINAAIDFPAKASLNISAVTDESRLLLTSALKELSEEPQ